jgi:histidyl-tRNA synthetase
MSAHEAVEQAASVVLGRSGYRRIETPTFEATEVFSRGVGEATDIVRKEMYSFDDGGERSMTLRPEGTASVCRSYIEHGMHKLQQPVRLWYSGSFYRHEAPQAGRQRQFHQIGAEAFGSDRPEMDAEMIVLLAELLEQLGVEGLELKVGSLGSAQARLRYREMLVAHLRSHEDRLSKDVRERIDLNPLRAFDSSDPSTREVLAEAPLLHESLEADDLEHFASVCSLLDSVGLAWTHDPTLVRGLDYYGRTVFEYSSSKLGAQSGVGGGGRYDALVELLGGQPTAAIGWAAGIERILLAGAGLAQADESCDLLVVAVDPERITEAFALAADARRAGLSARLETTGRSVKAAFKHASRIGAQRVALLGDDTVLRDMSERDQIEVDGIDGARSALGLEETP